MARPPLLQPVLALIFVGVAVSIYLGLFQLHLISSVWDPIFRTGSVQVLGSSLSRALPVPDSLVGAFGYFSEGIALLVGSSRKFGRGCWILFIYSVIAFGMGAVSVGLVFYQTDVIKSGCSLCLLSALISMGLVFPALQETLLSVRVYKHRRQQGQSRRKALRFFSGVENST